MKRYSNVATISHNHQPKYNLLATYHKLSVLSEFPFHPVFLPHVFMTVTKTGTTVTFIFPQLFSFFPSRSRCLCIYSDLLFYRNDKKLLSGIFLLFVPVRSGFFYQNWEILCASFSRIYTCLCIYHVCMVKTHSLAQFPVDHHPYQIMPILSETIYYIRLSCASLYRLYIRTVYICCFSLFYRPWPLINILGSYVSLFKFSAI